MVFFHFCLERLSCELCHCMWLYHTLPQQIFTDHLIPSWPRRAAHSCSNEHRKLALSGVPVPARQSARVWHISRPSPRRGRWPPGFPPRCLFPKPRFFRLLAGLPVLGPQPRGLGGCNLKPACTQAAGERGGGGRPLGIGGGGTGSQGLTHDAVRGRQRDLHTRRNLKFIEALTKWSEQRSQSCALTNGSGLGNSRRNVNSKSPGGLGSLLLPRTSYRSHVCRPLHDLHGQGVSASALGSLGPDDALLWGLSWAW